MSNYQLHYQKSVKRIKATFNELVLDWCLSVKPSFRDPWILAFKAQDPDAFDQAIKRFKLPLTAEEETPSLMSRSKKSCRMYRPSVIEEKSIHTVLGLLATIYYQILELEHHLNAVIESVDNDSPHQHSDRIRGCLIVLQEQLGLGYGQFKDGRYIVTFLGWRLREQTPWQNIFLQTARHLFGFNDIDAGQDDMVIPWSKIDAVMSQLELDRKEHIPDSLDAAPRIQGL